MRPDPLVISAGLHTFTISPLQLGQIRRILSLIQTTMDPMDRSMKIFQIALEKSHPDLSQDIDSLVIPFDEFDKMIDSVLKFAGFRPREGQPGE